MFALIFRWMEDREKWLKRIMAMNGYRSKQLGGSTYANYRPGLIFLGLIHGLYNIVFKVNFNFSICRCLIVRSKPSFVFLKAVSGPGEWPSILADYVRKNDEGLLKSTSSLLVMYQQQLLAATEVTHIIKALGNFYLFVF